MKTYKVKTRKSEEGLYDLLHKLDDDDKLIGFLFDWHRDEGYPKYQSEEIDAREYEVIRTKSS